MRKGQLVKLKPYSEVSFSDPEWGTVPFTNECQNCYCILIGYYDESRTCEILLDGAIGFNVNPVNLEVVS